MKKNYMLIIPILSVMLLSGFAPLDSTTAGGFDQTETLAESELQTETFSEQEAAGLLYMLEEEKLAHDLYAAFYEIYGLPAFNSIAASELTHAESIRRLLQKYGFSNAASQNAPGVFNDPLLQGLYNDLTDAGRQSLAGAIKAGALVEEIDILDLQARMTVGIPDDILRVYTALEAGSRNHLNAFVNLLQTQAGETYSPARLPVEEFEEILSSSGTYGRQGRQSTIGQRGPKRP